MSPPFFASIKHDWFRWLFVVGGAVCLVVMGSFSGGAQGDTWFALMFLILFTTLDGFFPLELLGQELGFGQLAILGVAFLYDPFLASLAGALGAGIAYGMRRIFAASPPQRSSFTRAFDHPFEWLDALVAIFQAPLALLLAILITGWRMEASFSQGLMATRWQPVVGTMAAFAAVHTFLALGAYLTRKTSESQSLISDLVMLVVLEFLPLPFLLVALVAYPQVGIGSIAALGALSFIMGLLMSTSISARIDVEHANQELITLNRISQVLRSSLELDNLLAGLQLQVRQWLSIDNFYIALYDNATGRIWYPMAVKHGELVNWPPRQIMERLTDKVILEGQPILLSHHAQLELERIGLPVGEDAPAAWMGVPLISSGQVIGCLGVFSFSPQTVFSTADLTVLTTISGQTSLAIQNTWLSGQVTSATRGRDQLAAVINSVSEGLLMIAPDRKIILANPFVAGLAGRTVADLVGASLPELPEDVVAAFGYTAQEMNAALEQLREGLPPAQTGQIFRTASGKRVLERSSSLVWSAGDRLIGWLILIRDVTEEQQLMLERELLTETLVHDLRSPMGAVLGALDVIGAEQRKEAGAQNDLVRRAIAVGQRGAQRVLNLINSILDIARWESGQMETNPVATQLSDLIEDILAEYLPQAWDFGLTLTSNVSQNLPEIMLDRERISRVLSNLVDNAVKFTPKGGLINLSAGLDSPEKVVVRLADSGPGIPPAYRQKIFERFRQVPDRQGRRRGSGLGLTFCKLAIEAHGGEIWVEESSLGGSEFVFSLPAGQTALQP